MVRSSNVGAGSPKALQQYHTHQQQKSLSFKPIANLRTERVKEIIT
jgi:hypothetical protein